MVSGEGLSGTLLRGADMTHMTHMTHFSNEGVLARAHALPSLGKCVMVRHASCPYLFDGVRHCLTGAPR
jgi:hypothetical protein